jgi:hypothetical protein
MDQIGQEHLSERLEDLSRSLRRTTDIAAAIVMVDEISDLETRLRTTRSGVENREQAFS